MTLFQGVFALKLLLLSSVTWLVCSIYPPTLGEAVFLSVNFAVGIAGLRYDWRKAFGGER